MPTSRRRTSRCAGCSSTSRSAGSWTTTPWSLSRPTTARSSSSMVERNTASRCTRRASGFRSSCSDAACPGDVASARTCRWWNPRRHPPQSCWGLRRLRDSRGGQCCAAPISLPGLVPSDEVLLQLERMVVNNTEQLGHSRGIVRHDDKLLIRRDGSAEAYELASDPLGDAVERESGGAWSRCARHSSRRRLRWTSAPRRRSSRRSTRLSGSCCAPWAMRSEDRPARSRFHPAP